MPNYIFDKSNNPYAPLPSLADSKTLRLSDKLFEKQQKLTPPPVPLNPTPEEVAAAHERLSNGAGNGDSLLNMAEASVYRGAGHIADSYANIRQNALGNTDFRLSEDVDNLSDEKFSDAKAGFTGREVFNADVNQLSDSVSKGNVIDSVTQGLALGPRALADSAASGIELAAGVAATAGATAIGGPILGAATGSAVFGKKVKDTIDTTEKVVTLAERIKKGAKAIPSAIVKNASKTSLLTADLTEQMRQEYKSTHNDEEPSAAYYATNIPITIALNAVEFGLISKAIPKFSKPTIKEMKESVKFMSKNHSVEAAKRIFNGTKKVVSAAGAEAGQEYLQTWHEILAPVVSGDTIKDLVATAAIELGKDNNQTEAIVGSILGFSAGGTARAAVAAPTVTAGLGVDAVGATIKTAGEVTKATGRGLRKVQNAVSLKVLSTQDRESIRNDYNIKKEIVNEKTAELDASINTITESKTHADILTDERLAPVVKEQQVALGFTDEDLNDADKLQTLKDRIVRKQKAAQALLRVELQTSNAAVLTKQITKNVQDLAVETAVAAIESVPEEVVVKTIETGIAAKDKSIAAVKAVKELKSSTALGMVEMGIKNAVGSSKTIITAATNLDPRDLKRVASVITNVNPKLGDQLTRLYQNKVDALKTVGLRNTDLVNKETLSPVVTSVASSGTLEGQSAPAVASAIKSTLASKIADKSTLETIKKAVAVYKASPAFTDKTSPGRIDETNMTVLENRLQNATDRLNKAITKENVSETVDKVKSTVGDTASKIKKSVTDAVPQVKKAATAAIDKVNTTIDASVNTKKILEKSKVLTAISTIIDNIDKGQVKDMLDTVPAIVTALQAKGYETANDLKDLVEQFPGLAKNEEFHAALKSRFKTETDVIMDETSDRVESTHADSNVAFKFFEAIGLTGCNK